MLAEVHIFVSLFVILIYGHNYLKTGFMLLSWVKVFRIIPEFKILRLTFHRKSASKCCIREIMIVFSVYIQSI